MLSRSYYTSPAQHIKMRMNMMKCEICNYEAKNYSRFLMHLYHQSKRCVKHKELRSSLKTRREINAEIWNKRFDGLIENIDFVVCKICNKKVKTLKFHIKNNHEINASEYRRRFGNDILISCQNTRDKLKEKRSQLAKEGCWKGRKRKIVCEKCGIEIEVSAYFCGLHKPYCSKCRLEYETEENHKKHQGEEGIDFVTCKICGWFRATQIKDHLAKTHKIKVKDYKYDVYCSNLRNIYKECNIGKKKSAETKQKISETRSKLLANGLVHEYSNRKQGWMFNESTKRNEYFASSYEQRRMQFLNGNDFKWTKHHGIKIHYVNEENIKRNYVPDILVDMNGNIFLEEVKGYLTANDELKFEAARNFCELKGIKFKILMKGDLENIY